MVFKYIAIESADLVEAILDDLIKTMEGFKTLKNQTDEFNEFIVNEQENVQ